jgi:outer membrane protein OmpA-like peptidoglycan-associated protein
MNRFGTCKPPVISDTGAILTDHFRHGRATLQAFATHGTLLAAWKAKKMKKMKYAIPALIVSAVSGFAQQNATPGQQAPIYHITVTERTVKAINYQYRNGPTLIDFVGTVLMPHGKGTASVDSKAGRTEIDANLENLTNPQQYGREYLTFVMWALTPDGRPHNIGEVVPGHSNKMHLRVTTDLQAFALIVTAEPHSAVRQPSDVVVLQNEVRPDTVGKIEEVEAKVELLPRGQYSWQVAENADKNAPKVSMRKYEELSQIYQAQNAIGIARAAGAEQFAPNTLQKAQQLLENAQQFEQHNGDSSRVIQDAREASQTAEDARVIADRQQQQAKLDQAQQEITAAQQAQAQAEAEAQRAKEELEAARSDADAAKARADAEQAARERAQANAAQSATAGSRMNVNPPPAPPVASRQSALRMRLLEQLNGPLATRDTPRGLVATVPNGDFNGTDLRDAGTAQIARIGSILAANPGLRIEVEGHAVGESSEPLSWKRAEAVRQVLVAHGISANSVTSRGLGDTHPLTSNSSPAGREENQRVEIVVVGDPIGTLPFWDHTYSLDHR